MNMRLRPKRSPSLPPSRISTANVSTYELRHHSSSLWVAFSDCWIDGRAMFTTVLSSMIMNSPKHIAPSVNHLRFGWSAFTCGGRSSVAIRARSWRAIGGVSASVSSSYSAWRTDEPMPRPIQSQAMWSASTSWPGVAELLGPAHGARPCSSACARGSGAARRRSRGRRPGRPRAGEAARARPTSGRGRWPSARLAMSASGSSEVVGSGSAATVVAAQCSSTAANSSRLPGEVAVQHRLGAAAGAGDVGGAGAVVAVPGEDLAGCVDERLATLGGGQAGGAGRGVGTERGLHPTSVSDLSLTVKPNPPVGPRASLECRRGRRTATGRREGPGAGRLLPGVDAPHRRAPRRSPAGCATAPTARVEAVFEGDEGDVASMVESVGLGPPDARVAAVETHDEQPEGLQGFVVVHASS